jgi:hypothetical protein
MTKRRGTGQGHGPTGRNPFGYPGAERFSRVGPEEPPVGATMPGPRGFTIPGAEFELPCPESPTYYQQIPVPSPSLAPMWAATIGAAVGAMLGYVIVDDPHFLRDQIAMWRKMFDAGVLKFEDLGVAPPKEKGAKGAKVKGPKPKKAKPSKKKPRHIAPPPEAT